MGDCTREEEKEIEEIVDKLRAKIEADSYRVLTSNQNLDPEDIERGEKAFARLCRESTKKTLKEMESRGLITRRKTLDDEKK